MNGNAEFAVPKDRQAVTVRLVNGAGLEGEIFLEYISEHASRHQKVTEFLEKGRAFFPHKVNGGGTEFVNKKNVQYVEVRIAETADADYFLGRPMQSIPVKALFNDGEAVSGTLMEEVPQEKGRLSDCLNLPNKFLNVRTNISLCYINKDALLKVIYSSPA